MSRDSWKEELLGNIEKEAKGESIPK